MQLILTFRQTERGYEAQGSMLNLKLEASGADWRGLPGQLSDRKSGVFLNRDGGWNDAVSEREPLKQHDWNTR